MFHLKRARLSYKGQYSMKNQSEVFDIIHHIENIIYKLQPELFVKTSLIEY